MPWLASRACLFVVESSYCYPVCPGKERADICGSFALARVRQYQAGRDDNGSLWSVAITRTPIPITGMGALVVPYLEIAVAAAGAVDEQVG